MRAAHFSGALLLWSASGLPESLEARQSAVPSRPCDIAGNRQLPFCNAALNITDRVADLLRRINLTEKVGLIHNGAQAVSSVGLPKYEWWSEALHGVAEAPGVSFNSPTTTATVFPQVVTTSHSFNLSLIHAIASSISSEARAFYNVQRHAGLTYWAPNINIFRDPRWGRGQETPGEDPFLSGAYAAAFIRGMQEGPDQRYLKTSACAKHFVAYSLETLYNGTNRHNFDAIVTVQDMTDTYVPAFEAAVTKGGASSIMCSYNRVNGVPSCASTDLLTKLARNTWHFDGYITSDCGAIDDIYLAHMYKSTAAGAVATAVLAGTDIDCGHVYEKYALEAVEQGLLKEEDVDRALSNLFRVQMRLGMFDPEEDQKYSKYGLNDVDTPEHKHLALEAARQGMVLLKNDAKRLPLKASEVSHLALIGPQINDTAFAFLGSYYGRSEHVVSVIEGMERYGRPVTHVMGCKSLTALADGGLDEARAAAAAADVTVLVVGIDRTIEDEDRDRISIMLPDAQRQLVKAVLQASGEPVVMVVISGGAIDLSEYAADERVGAIIFAGYSGQSGGQAIAETIFGDNNPSGRLTQTFYAESFVQQVGMGDMRMRPDASSEYPGRTYRFYTGAPVYPFGHGLSYTTFRFEDTICNRVRRIADPSLARSGSGVGQLEYYTPRRADMTNVLARVCVKVTNVGVAGRNTLLVFLAPPETASADVPGPPIKSLRAIGGVYLAPQESREVEVTVSTEDVSLVDEKGIQKVVSGPWTLTIDDYHTVIQV